MTTHINHGPSAAQGLHTYGLAGIELQRKAERRAPGIGGLTSDNHRTSVLRRMRQAAGDAFIRLGTGIGGETARPVATPKIQPKVDMA